MRTIRSEWCTNTNTRPNNERLHRRRKWWTASSPLNCVIPSCVCENAHIHSYMYAGTAFTIHGQRLLCAVYAVCSQYDRLPASENGSSGVPSVIRGPKMPFLADNSTFRRKIILKMPAFWQLNSTFCFETFTANVLSQRIPCVCPIADATAAIPIRFCGTQARVVRSTFASIGRTMKTFGMVSSYSCIRCLARAHSRQRRIVFIASKCRLARSYAKHNKTEKRSQQIHTPHYRVSFRADTFAFAAVVHTHTDAQTAHTYAVLIRYGNSFEALENYTFAFSKQTCRQRWRISKEGSVHHKPGNVGTFRIT